MNYEILKSGSSGNCTIIDGKIAIDIGVPYKTIEPYAKDLKVICLTHSHSDHINVTTIRKLKREHPNIKYICADYLVPKLISETHLDKRSIFILEMDKWYDMGLFKAKIESLYHDVPNCCWHIEYQGRKYFYATDTGRIEHISAKNYDMYFLEANYDTDEDIEDRIQKAHEKGEYTHLERVKYTHLSQLQALNWLEENMGETSSYLFMHKHILREKEKENIEEGIN